MTKIKTLLAVLALAVTATGIGFATGQSGTTVEMRVAVDTDTMEISVQYRQPGHQWETTATTPWHDAIWIGNEWVGRTGTVNFLPLQPPAAAPAQSNHRATEIDANFLGSTFYFSERDRFTGSVNSYASVDGTGTALYKGNVAVHCVDDQLSFIIADLPDIASSTDHVNVSFVVDDGSPFTRWLFAADSNGGDRNLYMEDWNWNDSMIQRIRSGSTLYVRLEAQSRQFNGTFDISDLFRTPVQANLENCGES